ncbi:hypothetical protein [Kitasatospora sp. NPDC091276]
MSTVGWQHHHAAYFPAATTCGRYGSITTAPSVPRVERNPPP